MSRRRLRPEELDLWHRVMRKTEALPGRPAPKPPEAAKRAAAVTPTAPRAPVPAFSLGQKALPRSEQHSLHHSTAERLQSDGVAMDNRAFTRLRRGKLEPEARIDLHGMTLDQAHPELSRFILTAQARGLRLVLVITGKGLREDPYDPMPRRRGVLKTQVPMWLKMAPLAPAVLQISEAHRKHGGGGAYYVYLKRRR
jgi:DNA-nicking Smr family endonuclease